jgi:hypothetical protein
MFYPDSLVHASQSPKRTLLKEHLFLSALANQSVIQGKCLGKIAGVDLTVISYMVSSRYKKSYFP